MTPKERFNAKVRKEPSGCWIWLGALADGQPEFKIDGKRVKVRRWAWRRGPIPRKLTTLCGQALCVRPAHLVATRSGPRQKPAEKPDDVVQYMLDNPRDHGGCKRRFQLTDAALIEILDTYYSRLPRTDLPTETAPLVSPRNYEPESNMLAEALLQLVETKDELW